MEWIDKRYLEDTLMDAHHTEPVNSVELFLLIDNKKIDKYRWINHQKTLKELYPDYRVLE